MGGVGRWRFAPATGKKSKPMSVRMALAKLCACTCGGAIIGSGAMQITDVPKARAQVQSCSPCVAKKKEIGRAHVRTPVTNAHLVCRLLLEKKNTPKDQQYNKAQTQRIQDTNQYKHHIPAHQKLMRQHNRT